MKQAVVCLIGLLLASVSFAQQSSPPALPTNLYNTPGGIPSSGNTAASVGPIINVTNAAYGASPSLADNNAAFTAAFTAANAATSTTNPAAPLTAPATAQNNGATATLTANVAIPQGSTVYVIFADSLNKAATITTDTGGTSFSKIGSSVSNTAIMQVYGTSAGGAAQSSTLTLTVTGSEIMTMAVVVLPGVSANVTSSGATGSSTAPSVTQATTKANSMVLTACGWYNAGTNATLTNGTGTLLTNTAPTGSVGTSIGLAMWGTFQGSVGSVTNSGTLSLSTTWACQSLEVQGGGTTPGQVTVYIPQGFYNYSGGLSMQQAGEKLQCEPGTFLNYTGNAHAVDMGIQGLSADTSAQKFKGVIDGCTFTGGTNMTAGVYIQPYNQITGIRNNNFINFGNSTSYMINAACENWDIELGPQNAFFVYDYQPRNLFIMNSNHCTANSFARIHDNIAACWPASQNNGCDQSITGTGFVVDGDENRVYHNNIAFFKPDVKVICSNPVGGGTCFGNQVDQNQFEAPATGTTTIGVIQYSGQAGMLITQNVFVMQATGASPVTPVAGTDIITGARVNFNTVSQIALATPLVVQNNLTGQGSNFSYSNNCSTAVSGFLPCALVHTTGGSIAQWNTDQWPSCTMNGSTGCTYSFSQTYGVAPKCTGTWNGTGALTGILKVVTNTTTATVTSSVAADTALIQLSCSAGDSQ